MGITKELPTVLSFCSGYAGIERGLDLAGFEHRVVAYVEIEAFAIANLVSKMEAGKLAPAPIWTNLKTFPAHLFRGAVDVITGGYPCQPFSAAGKRQGVDDPRHLWPTIREHINTIKPGRCFFENVEGHISLGLSSVIADLEENGYRATWGIFSAREVGAPHQRKRVYIMADTKISYDRQSSPCKSYGQKQEPRNSSGPDQLADTRCSSGSKGQQPTESRAVRSSESSESSRQRANQGPNEERQAWPAGAGDYQHEWEAPRVVWKTEPRLAGTVDGSPAAMDANINRVDRVRLLGNGVVPKTVAKAWITLNKGLL